MQVCEPHIAVMLRRSSSAFDIGVHLRVDIDKSAQQILLICSDGVWEFISAQEAGRVCVRFVWSKCRMTWHDESLKW